MAVDLKGFREKMASAGGLQILTRNLVQDGASYLQAKIADEVLNGETGTEYPKNYPASVSQGATGFVGVVSGNLRRSIEVIDKRTFALIISDPGAAPVAVYNVVINEWAKERYGMGYFEITAELYGDLVEKILAKEVLRFARSINTGRRYQYRNPFPA